jgi:endogenous inhibitor of DNA gyrase (YacG/DUF329 family)
MTEIEKQQIHDLRLKGIGYKAIAAVLGISRDSIRGYCIRNGLDGDSKAVAINVEDRVKNHLLCACCNKLIKQNDRGRTRRFCSDECRRKWWNDNPQARNKRESATYKFICPHCGQEFTSYGNKKRKYCCHNCFIKSRFWEDIDGI